MDYTDEIEVQNYMIPIIKFVYQECLYSKKAEVPHIDIKDLGTGDVYNIESYLNAASRDAVPLVNFDCEIRR